MQVLRDAGQTGFRKRRMLERRDAGKEVQEKKDAGEERCRMMEGRRKGGRQKRRETGNEGDRK